MQLLNTQNIFDSKTSQLLESLIEISRKVAIRDNFEVVHLDYQSPKIPAELAERFNQTPAHLQRKLLAAQLCNFLYGFYYNGYLRSHFLLKNSNLKNIAQDHFENNTLLGVDLEFYSLLHKSNTGEGYFDPGWLVVKYEDDGSIAVKKLELTLHIIPQKHLQNNLSLPHLGDLVAIRLPKNLVQNGFYMAVGNLGSESHTPNANKSEIARIYFNLISKGAPQVMTKLTHQINTARIPFSFKVLYNPSEYDRYDSGVLYFNKNDYLSIKSIIAKVYCENQSYFCPEIPLFTKLLAPGLAVAEEPQEKFSAQESFGQNRCQIVANGLLAARESGDESPENRLTTILKQFSLMGLSLECPYLNPGSTDIYSPLS